MNNVTDNRLPLLLYFHGCNNTRDLGGYKTTEGRTVTRGKIFRSGELSKISTHAGKIIQNRYGIDTLIDLRTEGEVSHRPIPKIDGVRYENIPVLREAMMGITPDDAYMEEIITALVADGWTEKAFMQQAYLKIVSEEHSHNAYKSLFEVLLSYKGGATVFCCSQGRDRTGIASMLILSALGVPMERITADYLFTSKQAYRQKLLVSVLKNLRVIDTDQATFAAAFASSSIERLNGALCWIDEHYDSINSYLINAIGLSNTQLDKLKELYLE
ncbi:MAG: tyrosine-protein phosphatase [Clostridia bacterium]|nr:tyrosine-protein phosphatase [Clostridia bacterium]